VAGEGFEPSKAEPGDLQSPPIGRSGNPPRIVSEVKSKALVVVMPKVQLFITIARNKSNMIRI
jgi:hypothetical protein